MAAERVDFALAAVNELSHLRSRSKREQWGRVQAAAKLRSELLVASIRGDAYAVREASECVTLALLALGVDPSRVGEFFGDATAQA